MYRFLVFSLIAVSVQFSVGQQTDANCTTATTACQQVSIAAVASNQSDQYKCSKFNETFQCLKNLTCVSDVHLRLLFSRAEVQLSNYSCNLTNDIYPAITTDGCPSKQRSCLFKYVDNLVDLSKTTNNSLAICLELANYAKCLLNNITCANETQVSSIVTSEQIRAKINSSPTCVIPSLKKSLTFDECLTAIYQCQTIEGLRANGSNECQKTQESSICIVGLNCGNDPILRFMNLVYKSKFISSNPCEIDNIYPLNQANLSSCQQVRKNCTYSYIDQSTEEPCKDLNSYITCLSKSTNCTTLDQLKELSDQEIKRTEIKACSVTAFSSGEGNTWSWLTMTTVLLCSLIFN